MQYLIIFAYSTAELAIFIGFSNIRAVLNSGVFNRAVLNRGVFNRDVLNRGVFNRAVNLKDLEHSTQYLPGNGISVGHAPNGKHYTAFNLSSKVITLHKAG